MYFCSVPKRRDWRRLVCVRPRRRLDEEPCMRLSPVSCMLRLQSVHMHVCLHVPLTSMCACVSTACAPVARPLASMCVRLPPVHMHAYLPACPSQVECLSALCLCGYHVCACCYAGGVRLWRQQTATCWTSSRRWQSRACRATASCQTPTGGRCRVSLIPCSSADSKHTSAFGAEMCGVGGLISDASKAESERLCSSYSYSFN